jgi:4-alpha-glucanotransferase
MTPELEDLCARLGVRTGYRDQMGQWQAIGAPTARAVLSAMGHPAGTDAEAAASLAALRRAEAARVLPPYVVVPADTASEVAGEVADWEVETEAGEIIAGRGAVRLPALPPGIHRLRAGGSSCVVLSAPPTLPPPPRAWGMTLPLYGLRTPAQGGLGDFADLARAVAALSRHGAGFAGINPIHAGFFPDAREYSPYAPSHRRRFNAAHVPAPGEREPDGPLLDYPRAYRARWEALKAAFEEADPDPAFDRFVAEGGPELRAFAIHQALSERFGPFWSDWPEAYRNRTSDEVARFAQDHPDPLRFHAWLQFRAEQALGAAAAAASEMRLGLYLDVAVGTHPHGAETWLEPGNFARGVSLGAPPDAFAKDGQVWGLAPLNPGGLIRSGFRPVAEMLRQQFRFSKVVRIDHILGFDRAFWVPEEEGVPGTYVAMPKDALLAVARIEAARAEGTIIGEDLGNIPEGLHDDLERSGILGCRVTMFELHYHGRPREAHEYPEPVLASFGTHDLPTFRGWREGRDIAAREEIGTLTAEARENAQSDRASEVARLESLLGGAEPAALERFLGASNARLVALQIEDILDIKDQPNLPGTVAEYPNWRRRLPIAPGDWASDDRLARAARIMRDAGRQGD